jgi:hypothetical protein
LAEDAPPKAKDCWDKALIAGQIVGSILIPVVVGISVWSFNSERTQRDTAAQMVSIAVSVLTVPADENLIGENALRQWAIYVLQNPDDPPALSDEAAQLLLTDKLSYFPAWVSTNRETTDALSQYIEALRELKGPPPEQLSTPPEPQE